MSKRRRVRARKHPHGGRSLPAKAKNLTGRAGSLTGSVRNLHGRAAAFAVILCILANITVASGAAASSRTAQVSDAPWKPLVLIGEPAQKEGGSIWDKAGLVSRLKAAGYKPGESLFVYTPEEPYGDLDSGARILRQLLDEVVSATGCKLFGCGRLRSVGAGAEVWAGNGDHPRWLGRYCDHVKFAPTRFFPG